MYKKIYIPLMLINNNVYTFISGILVSLSINIFTNLCCEKSSLHTHWFMYLATIAFLLSSALFMYLAAKLSRFQKYIYDIGTADYEKKKSIAFDATKGQKSKWIIIYIDIVLSILIGVGLLVVNFVSN